MTDNELMRFNRVKNAMYLTLTVQAQGKAGWTVKELAEICSTNKASIVTFLTTMKSMGFIKSNSDSTFVYSKKIPRSTSEMEKTAMYLSTHWGEASSVRSVPKKIYEFSNKELLAELQRRKLIK